MAPAEVGWLIVRGMRQRRLPSWRPETVEHRHRAKLLENPTNITLPGQNGLISNGSAAHFVLR
jgi:hypothetical protein